MPVDVRVVVNVGEGVPVRVAVLVGDFVMVGILAGRVGVGSVSSFPRLSKYNPPLPTVSTLITSRTTAVRMKNGAGRVRESSA